jgi:hypothetical protein
MSKSVSSNTAVALSAIAFLTGIARLILEIRFVPEIFNAMPEDQPGQSAIIILIFVVFFGGWLWSLIAAARGGKVGLIGLLVFGLLLALPWGLGTVVMFCPTPCEVAWPLQDIIAWSNVIIGISAAAATGLALRAKPQYVAAQGGVA